MAGRAPDDFLASPRIPSANGVGRASVAGIHLADTKGTEGRSMIATVRPYELSLTAPFGTARGRIEDRNGFLFDVFGDPSGLGEAAPLPPFTEPLDESRAVLATAADAYTEAGWTQAFRAVSETADGELAYPASRHAVSLAYLDWQARTAHDPLYRHLADGGERPGRDDEQATESVVVPLEASIGDLPAEQSAEEAAAAASEGYAAIKLKVGERDVPVDVERVRAVRSAIGPDAVLRLDANGAWTFEQARSFLESTADLAIDYLEQPLDPDDFEGHADLRGLGTDIALDETLALYPVDHALAGAAADAFVLKPMVLGGIDVARGTAIDLLDRGYRVSLATTIDSVVARTGVIHLAASLPGIEPSGLATGHVFERDLAPDPVPVQGGEISVTDAPGLAIEDFGAE